MSPCDDLTVVLLKRIRRYLLALVASIIVVSGCTSSTEPPTPPAMGQVGFWLHTCEQLDGAARDSCVDEALLSCPPEFTSRDACLENAREELAAFDAHEPQDARRAAPRILLIGPAVLTVGGLGLLGLQIARRTQTRNQAAFDAAARVLAGHGFSPIRVEDFPSVVEARGLRPARGLKRTTEPTSWALEFEQPGGGINQSWPARVAVVECDPPLPEGALLPVRRQRGGPHFTRTFEGGAISAAVLDRLEALLATHHPQITLASSHGALVLFMLTPTQAVGRRMTPALSLNELVHLAQTMSDEVDAVP